METRTIDAELRTGIGKNNCNRLRQSGFIPAVLYSHGEVEKIKIPSVKFGKIFKGHISESVIIDINITNKSGDSKHKAFVKDYQVDPVTNQLLHLDFFKVTTGEKIRTMVPVEIKGTPEGCRIGGVLEIMERELEIECLPEVLPERIEIDVTGLNIGQSYHIGEIKVDDSIRFLGSPDRVIVSVLSPQTQEEAVVAVEAGGDAGKIEQEPKQGE